MIGFLVDEEITNILGQSGRLADAGAKACGTDTHRYLRYMKLDETGIEFLQTLPLAPGCEARIGFFWFAKGLQLMVRQESRLGERTPVKGLIE